MHVIRLKSYYQTITKYFSLLRGMKLPLYPLKSTENEKNDEKKHKKLFFSSLYYKLDCRVIARIKLTILQIQVG